MPLTLERLLGEDNWLMLKESLTRWCFWFLVVCLAELSCIWDLFFFFLTRVRLYCEQDGREWGSGACGILSSQPETERMSPALEVRSLKQVLDPGLLLMKARLRMFWWNSLWSGIKPSLSFKTGSETSQQRPRTESWVKQKTFIKMYEMSKTRGPLL